MVSLVTVIAAGFGLLTATAYFADLAANAQKYKEFPQCPEVRGRYLEASVMEPGGALKCIYISYPRGKGM